jgi:hypothetical protein
MFKIIASLAIIPGVFGSFRLPDNSEFKINYFNGTNCSESYENSTIQSICLETEIIKGFPQCCNKLLSEVGFGHEVEFGKCYPVNFGNSSISSLSYECRLTQYHNMTTIEVFSFVGVILLGLFIITLLLYAVCRGRSGYGRV